MPQAADSLKRTMPKYDEGEGQHDARTVMHVVRVLGYDRPSVAGSRHSFAGVSEVVIGRGERDESVRDGGVLTLRVADPRMSQRHARLVEDDGGWRIEDLGSTNGTVVDGERVDKAHVEDGTLIELGCTAFALRELAPGRPDVDARELAEPLPGVRTFSPVFEAELAALARLAATTHSIVIHGETGTGKEVIARAIHDASSRAGSFVAVNCGALPANLVESELFGHKKGAFSGATDDRLGLVRAADRGTLVLDEIAELPLPAQVALLRVIQQREVMPIGASRPVAVDLRVVAASHRDLEAEVETGRFREDLWSRIAGYTAQIPALRDRREDLGLLVATLLARTTTAPVRFHPEAGWALMRYDWPRNVRELEQVLGAALALASDGVIQPSHLPRALHAPAPAPPPPRRAPLTPEDVARREQLCAALARHAGNIAAVGRELGVARMQIHRWLERYDIDVSGFRGR